MQVFDLDTDETNFGAVGLYPMDSEELRFSTVKNNNHIGRPNLYLQFTPSKIPNLNNVAAIPHLVEKRVIDPYFTQNILKPSWENTEELEEVVIHGNKKLSREEQLTKNAFGKVKIIDDQIRKSYMFFGDYIRTQGFKVFKSMGTLVIINPRHLSMISGGPVRVYLDNVRLQNTDILYKYSMDNIDYITLDKSGTSEGGLGASGVIKIYTDPLIAQNKMREYVSQNIKVPLSFSCPKKFYVPQYSSYNGRFYQNYGVIGFIHFSMALPKINTISLYLEGEANDGSLLSEKKDISINTANIE